MGGNTLIINLKSLRPEHFDGIIDFSGPQEEAIRAARNRFGDEWIAGIVKSDEIMNVHHSTLRVLKRKFDNILGVYMEDGELKSRGGVFRESGVNPQ